MASSSFVVGGRTVLQSDLVLTLKVTAFEGCGSFIEANRSRINEDPTNVLLDRSERAPTEERTISFTIVLSFCNPPGQSRSQFIIGRDPTCDIVLTSRAVSNHHIKFGFEGDHVVLYDVSLRGSEIGVGGREPQRTSPIPGTPYRCILPPACLITLDIPGGLVFELKVPGRRGVYLEEFRKKRHAFLASCSDFGALNTASQIPTLPETPSRPAPENKPKHMYWFGQKLGRGGCGVVYKVRRLQDYVLFAAKQVLEPESRSHANPGSNSSSGLETEMGRSEAEWMKIEVRRRRREAEKRMLKKEMKALQSLRHERIVEYVDWYEDRKDCWILVMEYCQHGSLDQMIWRARAPFQARETAEILKQTAQGLLYLHGQGITHRDLKPGNILVRSQSPLALALGDFGLAKNKIDGGSNMETTCGTPRYMAREMWEDETYTKAVDIWALGVVGFELLNHGLPELPKIHRKEYPYLIFEQSAAMHDENRRDRLVANVMKMLAWDARDRPDAAECVDDANDVLNALRPTQPSHTFPSAQGQVQPPSEARNRTPRPSEIQSYEKHFQTTGWRDANADSGVTVMPGQRPTQKRGTDALPRSNSAEAPAPKAPRTNVPSQANNSSGAARQNSAQTSKTGAPSQGTSPATAASRQQPAQSSGTGTNAPPHSESPSATAREAHSTDKTIRKIPLRAELKEQHLPQRRNTSDSTPPRTNSPTTARQNPQQTKVSDTPPQPNPARTPGQQPTQHTGANDPSRSDSPSATTGETPSTQMTARKIPPRTETKEQHPPQKRDTSGSTLPRANSMSPASSKHNHTQQRGTNVAPQPSSGAVTAKKRPCVDNDGKKA